ncbi:unnamed protein product [Heterobilharzia americana]|nr:unnamed protein product [Heterobilharzia americana]
MLPTTRLKRTYSLLVGSDITIKFLLPNGIIVPLTLSSELTLQEAKTHLWISAAKLPLFDILQSSIHYVFVGVNRETGDEEEFYDQSRRLHELPLILPYLRVIEAARDSALLEINTRNAAIASCTGMPHTDIVRACRTNPEVKWARSRLLNIANRHTKVLLQTGSDGLLRYLTSASKRELSQSLKILLQKLTHLTITAWVLDGKDPPKKCRVVIELDKKATVFDALNEILHSQAELAKQDCQINMDYGLPEASNYLLKVCCSQAYLSDSSELLIHYEYIQQCIEQHQHPCLSPMLKKDIQQSLQYSLDKYNMNPVCKINAEESNWLISSEIFVNRSVNKSEDNISSKSSDLYQELERFLSSHDSDDFTSYMGNDAIDYVSTFDFTGYDDVPTDDGIEITTLNSSSKKCSSKFTDAKQKIQLGVSHQQKGQQIVSLWELSGYLSIQVLSGQFLVENITNSNSSSASTSLSLSAISSSSLSQSNSSLNSMLQHASVYSAADLDGSYVVRVGVFHGSQFLIECQTTKERPGNYLTWREWLNFHVLLADIPSAARICVALIRIRKISDRKNVKFCEYLYGWANVNLFDHDGFMVTDEITLNLWPPSLAQTADESFHPCGTVLGNPNPEFTIQALKTEAYLDNPLTRFILYRALRNPLQIGLRFFWHLRSELHLPDIRLRFGLILEAFCQGCGPMLVLLSRQVTALNRLEALSTRVKELTSEEEQRERFHEEVSRPETLRDLQWLPSPLRVSEILGELVIDKCDIKRSKKRPLWLVWTNSDRLAQFHHPTYQLIFKHGDDLRQDMLTLQLLGVMDRIWKEEGMDMCLTSYGCFATGYDVGIIEAVRDSRTVMSIQGERLRSALQIDSTQLYKWLTQHAKQRARQMNQSPLGDSCVYERMIRTFTKSCAGYCIATFILGIRDRHPDNIMVDSTGRLFHIDFGHILDNRKKKFGITRERVPFVLTKDFITVIARGNPDAGTMLSTTAATTNTVYSTTLVNSAGGVCTNMHFQEFTDLCGKAYLLLRKHSNLILTLLAMMLPCGLPELTSVYDLDYVRKTLAVEIDNEQEALAYFYHQFNEAYSCAWTTKIDWFSHWMNT